MPKAEAVLRDALMALGHPQPRFPDNSEELAAAAVSRTGGARTQVALVYADGNRVGAFLAAAAELAVRDGRPRKEEIVTAIGQATVAALADTVRDLFGTRAVLPVIPNVADGDDIMVSTTAGMVNRTHVREIRIVGRNTQGVKVMNLTGEDKLVSVALVARENVGDAAGERPV